MLNDTPILPSTGLIRLPVVLQFIPVSKSTWWQGVKDGRFPKPVKLGERIRAWQVEEIRALMVAFPAVAGKGKAAKGGKSHA
ncbi:MAG: AlpA family phage regulatory protein [Rickettsiales bacterium]